MRKSSPASSSLPSAGGGASAPSCGCLWRARRSGFGAVWLRALPWNAAALSCYASAGFVGAPVEREAEFNRGQPRAYAWMSYAGPTQLDLRFEQSRYLLCTNVPCTNGLLRGHA